MKIRVLKGYLAHEGEMYGKGEVVDIKKKTVALSLLESDKFESAEDDPIEVPEPLEVVPDEPEDEFAEGHNLNGTVAKAIIQSPTARESFLSNGSHVSNDGLHGVSVFVHCKLKDIPEIPSQGNVFRLDDDVYIVQSATEEDGLVSIELRAEARGGVDGWLS